MTDDPADVVQPDGQGDSGSTDAPYAEHLSRIPEELRGQVEPVFKDWDAATTRRFQEHAEFRKNWEPFQESGINQHSPEMVQFLAQFGHIAGDQEQLAGWIREHAAELGVELAPDAAADEFTYDDPAQQFEKLLAPIQQRLDQYEQRFGQQDEQARLQDAQKLIDRQFAELKGKHPDEFGDDKHAKQVRDFVEGLAMKHADPNNREAAIPLAFAEYQQMRNAIEQQTLQGKLEQPKAALSGGPADGSPEPVKTLEQARGQAIEFLRNRNTA